MAGPPVAPIAADAQLPAQCDVVVIGGGIVGACTALELSERGVSVVLCEKGELAGEQSSRNWGWIRVSRRDPREIALVLEAQRAWQAMEQRLGESVGYVRSGIAFVAHDERELERQQRWLARAEPFRIRARLLEGDRVERLFPGVNVQGLATLHTEDDGRAEPQLATSAIARAAQRHGARVLTGCAVRGIECSAGAVSAVVTERGTIRCERVVLAAGAWSSLFCRSLGVRLPQLKLLSSALRTAPLERGPSCALWTREYAVRRRQDGGTRSPPGTTTSPTSCRTACGSCASSCRRCARSGRRWHCGSVGSHCTSGVCPRAGRSMRCRRSSRCGCSIPHRRHAIRWRRWRRCAVIVRPWPMRAWRRSGPV